MVQIYLFTFLYSPDDTIGDLKKLISAKTGTPAEKIVLKKWYYNYILSLYTVIIVIVSFRYTIYKDFLTLADYEIADGMSLEMSYQ